MSGILTEYTPREPRSSDQAPRGDFSSKPQKPCSGRGEFPSIRLLTLTGVVQGDPTTYDIPSGGLANGETYNIPLQVNASGQLATRVYPYTMTVTENFGTGMGA